MQLVLKLKFLNINRNQKCSCKLTRTVRRVYAARGQRSRGRARSIASTGRGHVLCNMKMVWNRIKNRIGCTEKKTARYQYGIRKYRYIFCVLSINHFNIIIQKNFNIPKLRLAVYLHIYQYFIKILVKFYFIFAMK